MIALDWRTALASGFLLLAAAALIYRWPDTESQEHLGGGLLLVGVTVDVFEDELADVLGIAGSPLGEGIWLVALLIVLAGAGLLLFSPDE